MLILLHSSKTMHSLDASFKTTFKPALQAKAQQLATYLQTLSIEQLMATMKINVKLAAEVGTMLEDWSTKPVQQRSAVHAFAGDIYSGLQIQNWDQSDLSFAQDHLRILSGLYGVLRPLDGIMPYRLEMGYRLPNDPYANLYNYWGDAAAQVLPDDETIIDLSAKEYGRLVLPYLNDRRVITPKFLTVSSKTGEPTFIVVHAKIARGAFAAWLVQNRVDDPKLLPTFSVLGYRYNQSLSSADEPVFICEQFEGLGLSVRLQHK